MSYTPTWASPYFQQAYPQAQQMPMMPQVQQPINGITKVNGPVVRPLVIRGQLWRVVRVSPGDPLLIDRTGTSTIATADPVSKVIRISTSVPLSMFDKVFMHEAAHAMMEEAGVTELLEQLPDERQQVLAEELLAWFLETYGIEVIDAVSSSLGRPACVDGLCIGGSRWR